MRRFEAIVALALIGAAPPITQDQVGPAPAWSDALALGEAALKAKLIDPASAQIEWPYHFVAGSLKGALGRRRFGYFTCGRVNSKNVMGGYSGAQWFLVMFNSGVVTELDIGTPDRMDTASASCPDFVRSRTLTPVPLSVR